VVDLVAAAALCRLLGLAGLGIATSLALIVTAVFGCAARAFPFKLRISRKEIADFDARGSTVLADRSRI